MLKQFRILLLITSLLFIYSTHHISATTYGGEVHVYNHTEYDLSFNVKEEVYNLPAHTNVKVRYRGRPPIVVSFWAGSKVDVVSWISSDYILFSATLKSGAGRPHRILITTDEHDKIIFKVEMVK